MIKKTIMNIIIVVLFLIGSTGVVSAAPGINVTIDGESLQMDVAPVNIEGRILVPLRAIFEALGADITWDDSTKTVTGTKDDTVIVLQIGSRYPTVNGTVVEIDVPGTLVNNRTMVPARFIAEGLNAKVDWSSQAQTVLINRFPNVVYVPNEEVAIGEASFSFSHLGNSGGNIYNGGSILEYNGWIYFSNISDYNRLYKVRADGTGYQKLSDDGASYINIVDGWIYFVANSRPESTQHPMKASRIRIDGTDEQMLAVNTDRYFRHLSVSNTDNWLYLANYGAVFLDRIERVGKDGSGRNPLINTAQSFVSSANQPQAIDRQLFYTHSSTNFLMKASTDGDGKDGDRLLEIPVEGIQVAGTKIYFINKEDGRIYRSSVDGTNVERLNDIPSEYINVSDNNWIYYASPVDRSVYRMKLNGSNNEKISEGPASSIIVTGGFIYYMNPIENQWYRMSDDGGNHRKWTPN